MKDTRSAIEAQMQLYFDGLYHSDTERLGKVFHPDARYICATDDKLVNLGLPEYFPIVDVRPSPASRGEKREDRIISIILAGPKTALVHAHCAIGSKFFTDFLTFIEDQGRWRVIAKVFHYDVLQQPNGPNTCLM